MQERKRIADTAEPWSMITDTLRRYYFPRGSSHLQVLKPCPNCGQYRWIPKHKDGQWLHCHKCVNSCKRGIPLSPEHRAKLSQALKGRKSSIEARRKLSNSLQGHVIAEATKAKISQSLKGRKIPKEVIEKIRQANLGKRHSPDGNRIINKQTGYIYLYYPNHPFSNASGHIFEHRYIMEQKLGRYLLPTERVHHIDGDKANNSEVNLLLLSPSEHLTRETLCRDCPLRKEIRLLRWQVKQLILSLQLKLDIGL